MKIGIIKAGKSESKSILQLTDFYTVRINKFISGIDIIDIKESKNKNLTERLKQDNESFKKAAKSNSFKIAMWENGRQYSSKQFAELIQGVMNQGKDVSFYIGGAFGLPEEIIKEADMKVSLSKMTMQHDIALIVLLEQIYRAFTILNNHPYHK